MRLAFSGEARYADCSQGYRTYLKRNRNGEPVDEATYRRVLKAYCKMIAERLKKEGMVDLPGGLGTISATIHTKKALYKNGKFKGYGAMDWKNWRRDGELKAFGIAFLPRHDKGNLRCYGFVANKQLFTEMKEIYHSDECLWIPMEFNEDMI